MLKVGITGGIASGKSTITKYLLKAGYKVIDADFISREVLTKYPEILRLINITFGTEVFDGGKLDRRQLGNIVFENREKKRALEAIIIPFIIKEINLRFREFKDNKEKIVFLDAPTLIENNLHREMKKNILVWVDRNTQIERVCSRDNFSEEEAVKRIEAQIPLDEKKKFVDYIIDNTGTINDTLSQMEDVLLKLKGEL